MSQQTDAKTEQTPVFDHTQCIYAAEEEIKRLQAIQEKSPMLKALPASDFFLLMTLVEVRSQRGDIEEVKLTLDQLAASIKLQNADIIEEVKAPRPTLDNLMSKVQQRPLTTEEKVSQ